MKTLASLFPWIQTVLAALTIILVLLQKSDAGLGGSFGGDGSNSGFHTKRGAERTLFIATIIVSVLFTISAVVALVLRA